MLTVGPTTVAFSHFSPVVQRFLMLLIYFFFISIPNQLESVYSLNNRFCTVSVFSRFFHQDKHSTFASIHITLSPYLQHLHSSSFSRSHFLSFQLILFFLPLIYHHLILKSEQSSKTHVKSNIFLSQSNLFYRPRKGISFKLKSSLTNHPTIDFMLPFVIPLHVPKLV